MIRFDLKCAMGIAVMLAGNAMAQSGSGSGPAENQHLGFDRPESWALKYFASTTLLSGLEMPEQSPGGRRTGSVTAGVELDWVPTLDPGQRRVGFNGTAPEDLNKAPIFGRAVVRVGLPWKLSVIAAAPPPFRTFGVTSHLFAFGLERPVFEREGWTLGLRGYGQVGSIKGAFTCPRSVLAFSPGSANNPQGCVGESADVATLQYAGMQLQFTYRIPSMPKLIPHAAVGGNFIDGAFHVDAPLKGGLDRTRLWTRGGTFSTTAGVSYLVTKRAAITVDVFYSPLWVQRSAASPRTNDGLFNVRAALSYSFR